MNADFRKRAIFTIVSALAASAAALLIWTTREILLLLFAGLVAAVAYSSAVSWLQAKLRVSRTTALAVLFAVALLAISTSVWTGGSSIVNQLSDLQVDLPAALRKISASLDAQVWGHWLLTRFSASSQIATGLGYALPRLGTFLAGTASIAVGIMVVLMVSVYVVAEPTAYVRVLHLLAPGASRGRLDQCLRGSAAMLRSWLVAKALAMLSIGAIVLSGLLVLRIPLAGTLAFFAALFTFIPNLGPILSALPAAALAFAISPGRGLLTVLLYCAAHFLEGNLVTPLLERKIVSMPPALTLAVQLLLGAVCGALGIVLAAPLCAAGLGALQAVRIHDATVTDNLSSGLETPTPRRRSAAKAARFVKTIPP